MARSLAAAHEIDSAGRGELVLLYTTASQYHCRLCLVRPTPRIARMLETTKLDGILPHFDDPLAAWIPTADCASVLCYAKNIAGPCFCLACGMGSRPSSPLRGAAGGVSPKCQS